MIRRRHIGAKKPTSQIGSNYPGLAFAKGITREAEKIQTRLEKNERISTVRRQVWARSEGRCELCRETEPDAFRRGDTGKLAHELHECYSRAKTRRMKAALRFSTAWCIRVCPACHRRLTATRLVVAFFDVTRGADAGPQCMAAVPKAQFPMGWFTAEEVWQHAATIVEDRDAR